MNLFWAEIEMSMRELFCPDPLTGFKKMVGFQIFLHKNKLFTLITWKEQAICLQKLQGVVITSSLLNFLEEYLIAKRTLSMCNQMVTSEIGQNAREIIL